MTGRVRAWTALTSAQKKGEPRPVRRRSTGGKRAERHLIADALYAGLTLRDNLARMAFLDPGIGAFVPDPESLARCTVATLRPATGPRPYAPQMVDVIGELSRRSASFRRLWERHDVHRKNSAVNDFRRPVVGPLTVHQHIMTLPDQELQTWIYQAEPDSPSEGALRALGELGAAESVPDAG